MSNHNTPNRENWRDERVPLLFSSVQLQKLIITILVFAGLMCILLSTHLSRTSENGWWTSFTQSIGTGLLSSALIYLILDLNLRQRYENRVQPISVRLDALLARELVVMGVYVKILLWLYPHTYGAKTPQRIALHHDVYLPLVRQALFETSETHFELTRFCAGVAAALTQEQSERYANLIDKTYTFWDQLNDFGRDCQSHIVTNLQGVDCLAVLEYLKKSWAEIEQQSNLLYLEYYQNLEKLLNDVNTKNIAQADMINSIQYWISNVALRSLPNADANLIILAIETVHNELHGVPFPHGILSIQPEDPTPSLISQDDLW